MGRYCSSSLNASIPPAEAPTPATEHGADDGSFSEGAGGSWLFVRFDDCFFVPTHLSSGTAVYAATLAPRSASHNHGLGGSFDFNVAQMASR
jgi:hypothetical protein